MAKKSNLISVEKDGVTIEVHPSALEEHVMLGWQVVEQAKPATKPIPGADIAVPDGKK